MVKTDLPPPQSETEAFVVFQPVALARRARKKTSMMVIPAYMRQSPLILFVATNACLN